MKKLKGRPKKLKLNEINELSMAVFIVKRKDESSLQAKLNTLGAKIVSITRGIGVSRNTIFESLRMGTDDVCVFFAIARIEDVRDIMKTITEEFDLTYPGNGKGFVLDIDGYLGAKAKFLED